MIAPGAGRRSLSERFNVKVNAQTGGATCTIPIETSKGRVGAGPELRLEYGSGTATANSVFGMGWRLAGVDSITRKTLTVPTYDDDRDTFVHSSLGDLVPAERSVKTVDGYQVREYCARFETQTTRVEYWTESSGQDTFWRTISSTNVVTIYGRGDNDQVFHLSDGLKKVFSWLASEEYDGRGNHVGYVYKAENSAGIHYDRDVFEKAHPPSPQRYLKSILYGNTTPSRSIDNWSDVTRPSEWLFEIIFDYGDHGDERPTAQEEHAWELRPDPFSNYNSGFEIRTYRRCHRVLMFHHFPSELGRQDCLVSSTCFGYETDERSGASFFQSCVQKGHTPKGETDYWTLSLPPVELSYTTGPPSLAALPVEELDLRMSGLDTPAAQWIDLNGEGAPGVLTKVEGAGWYYQRNLARDGHPQIGEPLPVAVAPSTAQSAATGWHFEDIRGNRLLDVVVVTADGSLRGFYEREEDGGWLNFVPFDSYPMTEDSDAFRSIDLTGSGHADLLRMTPTASGSLVWNPSQGPLGFSASQTAVGAPVLSLDDPMSLIQLCDMSGDGLADIVEIRNNSICYWPNTGHGTFGSKVVMGHAPRLAPSDLFSPRRIRSADLTGSGTTDLIYVLPEGGTVVYYNRSGNDWSDGHTVPSFHSLDDASAVDVLDLGAQGGACLCWISDRNASRSGGSGLSTVRYVNLSGPQRPGLLERWSNGLGLETTFTYRPSSSFYVDDEIRGTPWATKLPFPLLCVAQTVTVDRAAQTSSTARYAYHNGYYDYAEKAFRGFQMVETWDAEDFDSSLTASSFQRPPVLTRQWFYVGLARLDEPSSLPWSYDVGTSRHALLASATIPSSESDSSSAAEEAYRALAGRERRTEVFSADPSDPKAAFPYLISQQNYQVALLQEAPHRLAWRVHQREEITAHYERTTFKNDHGQLELSLDDSRVQHRLTLQTDSYGNVLLEALVSYGKPSSQLPDPDDQRKQKETILSYTEMAYTNAIEADSYFQAPLIAEVRNYRVFTAVSVQGQDRYAWETLAQHDAGLLRDAVDIPIDVDPYEQIAHIDPKGYRILLAEERTLYTLTDLRGPLPVRQLDEFSIVHQKYQKALTSDLLQNALDGARPAIDAQTLTTQLKCGGYVELGVESGTWWIPSSRAVFGDDDPDGRLKDARTHFYIPDGEIDVYGNVSTREFDKYYLLVRSTTNAVGSTTSFNSDYARLQIVMTTDANKNRVQTALDPLGRSIGAAILGKEGGSIANSLDGFQSEIDQATLEAFFNTLYGETARSLLANASRRTIYDFNSYQQSSISSDEASRPPARVAELTRHDHLGTDTGAASRISVRITYLDGTGAGIQSALLSSEPDKDGNTTWDFTGCVIDDNKGQPVQKFQPLRAPSHAFQRPGPSAGAQPDLPATTLLRDPLGRIVGILYPDHSWSKTRFTPWTQLEYDAGNTSGTADPATDEDLASHFQRLARSLYFPTWRDKTMADDPSAKGRQAVLQSEVYADAPTATYLDVLGRIIFTETGKGQDMRHARVDYDARGRVSKVRDGLDRTVETAQYDLLGRRLRSSNMDGGRRWLLPDCDGLPLLSWSDRGTRMRFEYDAQRRVKSVWTLFSKAPRAEIEVIRKIYGEEQPDATSTNLHGQLYKRYDQSGLLVNFNFDVLGGCTASTRRYADEYRTSLDWSAAENEETALEKQEYTTQCRYNALGLPVENTSPDLGRTQREYDIAGRLSALESYDEHGSQATTSSTKNIEYGASNKVVRIEYGDKSRSINVYDERMQRLVATRTVRTTDGRVLQDISYTYDCLGKVVRTENSASMIMDGTDSVSPAQKYRYDCLGQLTQTTARIQVNPESKQLPPYGPKDAIAGRSSVRYTETYTYDRAGNMLRMRNAPGGGYSGWTRTYTYAEPSCILDGEMSNRLTRTAVGNVTEEYRYDGDAGRHGCMTSIPGYSQLSWDDNDHLRAFSTQRMSADAIPETTWYVYDAEGTRVRKVTERSSRGISGTVSGNNTAVSDNGPRKSKETRYLSMGDIFSVYRGNGTETSRTTKTLCVGDAALGRSPVAVVEHASSSSSSSGGTTRTLTRYQLSEQLEIDDGAKMVSYQEYSPYGSSTYRAANADAPRAYRFASYRWDTESGLYCCGERYYAPWLGRWTSTDPLGVADGLNLFAYVRNDPINFDDPGGTTKTKKGNKTPSEASVSGGVRGQGPAVSTSSDNTRASNTSRDDRIYHNEPPPIGRNLTRLWRATEEMRGIAFVHFKVLAGVRTKNIGNFNLKGEKASYWAMTRESAEAHAEHLVSSTWGQSKTPMKKVLIFMDVPEKTLKQAGSNVLHYGLGVTPEWTQVSVPRYHNI
jgi:RHS repeat-associated protein